MHWERWLNLSHVAEFTKPNISTEWPPKYWLHAMGNIIIQELKNYHKERRKSITPEWPNELKWIPEPCPFCGIRLDICDCQFNYPLRGTTRI
ncbi:hypothetical protein LCGC14_1881770 [marine sediment metagenome]|uniref:Uncharacterized protein n=1 Tax=marine sediment metagenome TaxID=412755 RepID=A0A0F9GQC0_9ZZZZ